MKTLAAIDRSDSAPGVLETARSLAALLATEVEAVHVYERGEQAPTVMASAAGVTLRASRGDATAGILKAIRDDNVVMAVIGTGGPGARGAATGHVARSVMTNTSKPIVLVPPESVELDPAGPAKVIVPLDSASATTGGLRAVSRWGGAPSWRRSYASRRRRAGLIAIAWSQDLAPGHAPVVTELLRATRVPVLLVPVDMAAARPAPLLLEDAA